MRPVVSTPDSFVATWILNSAPTACKYALTLSAVAGGGRLLDGDWTDLPVQVADRQKPDDYSDDAGQGLLSGSGVAGTHFELHFSVARL